MLTRMAVFAVSLGAAAALVTGLSGCTAPFTTPSAKDILAMPGSSSMKDAHATFEMSGVSGDGVYVFKPRQAYDLAVTVSAPAGSTASSTRKLETRFVGGSLYVRSNGGLWGKTSQPFSSGSDSAFKINSGVDPKLLGEDNLPTGKAWHVRTHNLIVTADVWVRKSDGYLLKIHEHDDTRSGHDLTVKLDGFNTGRTVAAPASSEMTPTAMDVKGVIGQPSTLHRVAVTVYSANLDYKPRSMSIKPVNAGDRFVVLDVEVTNLTQGALPASQLLIQAVDSTGHTYPVGYSDASPRLSLGTRIAAQQKVRGIVTIEVPATATGLAAHIEVPTADPAQAVLAGRDKLTIPLG